MLNYVKFDHIHYNNKNLNKSLMTFKSSESMKMGNTFWSRVTVKICFLLIYYTEALKNHIWFVNFNMKQKNKL